MYIPIATLKQKQALKLRSSCVILLSIIPSNEKAKIQRINPSDSLMTRKYFFDYLLEVIQAL
jgi:hypothetical protein